MHLGTRTLKAALFLTLALSEAQANPCLPLLNGDAPASPPDNRIVIEIPKGRNVSLIFYTGKEIDLTNPLLEADFDFFYRHDLTGPLKLPGGRKHLEGFYDPNHQVGAILSPAGLAHLNLKFLFEAVAEGQVLHGGTRWNKIGLTPGCYESDQLVKEHGLRNGRTYQDMYFRVVEK